MSRPDNEPEPIIDDATVSSDLLEPNDGREALSKSDQEPVSMTETFLVAEADKKEQVHVQSGLLTHSMMTLAAVDNASKLADKWSEHD